MNLIACIDKNWAIGKNNKLLFNIKNDLKFFKEKTENNIVVMGYNTFESLPTTGLPFRKNFVLTRKNIDILNTKFSNIPQNRNITFINNIDYILKLQNENLKKEIFIIGGEQIYNLFLPYCKTAFITKVYTSINDADTFFPNLDNNKDWSLYNKSSINKTCNFDFELLYQFLIYKNNKNF